MKRGSGWVLRVRVPDALRKAIGKREVWRTLGAGTHRQAAERARLERVRVDAEFASARETLSGRPPAPKPTHEAILHAARVFFHRLEAKAPAVALLAQEDREDRLEAAIAEAVGIAHADPNSLQPVAKDVATEVGLKLDGKGVAELAHALHAAMLENAGRQVSRLEGARVLERDPVFAGIGPDRAPAAPRMTLAEAVKSYGATPERRHLTERTHAAVAQRLSMWAELLGPEKPIAAITRAMIREARELLIRLPAHAPKKWKGVPLREVVQIAVANKIPAQSPKNATNSVITLAALFAWAEREGHISRSPAGGLGRIEHVGHREKPRRPFSTEELTAFFATPRYRAPVWGLQQWAPMLSLFGGLRAGEIIGLLRADIAEEDGVPVIHIRPHEDRRLKTTQSERAVPVHPKLIAAGFLDWVASLPPGGPPHLFADRSDELDASEKRLGRAVRALFEDRRLVFHSFRHTWVDALRAAEIPAEVAERLGGWRAPGSARSGYGIGFRSGQLSIALARMDFPGLSVPSWRRCNPVIK